MRLLFLNQFYAPDIAATAQLLSDVCEDLAAAGHSVSVICGTGRYRLPHRGSELSSDAKQALPRRELRSGVDVRRIFTGAGAAGKRRGAGRLLHRLVDELRFSGGVLRELASLRNQTPPDVIVTLSSPPLLLPLGIVARTLLRAPLLFWVQDVYPELLFALALDRHDVVAAVARAGLPQLWRWLYAGVDGAVALDEAMARRLLTAGLSPSRTFVIEHFADCREITPQPPSKNRLRQALGLTDVFLISYAGNLGRGHDFETVAEALKVLAQHPDEDARELHFLFVGDGEKKAALRAAVPPELARRVHFLPPQSRSELRDVLTVGDVGLITLAAELSGLMVPSKLYALLAAGLPIVYVGPPEGRVAELCTVETIGESVRNGDAAGLVAAWLRLLRDGVRREAMAKKSRQLAETRFDRPLITAQHQALLSRIADGGRRPRERAGR